MTEKQTDANKKFICPHCNYVFSSKYRLSTHMQKKVCLRKMLNEPLSKSTIKVEQNQLGDNVNFSGIPNKTKIELKHDNIHGNGYVVLTETYLVAPNGTKTLISVSNGTI